MHNKFLPTWMNLPRTWRDWRRNDALPAISADLPGKEHKKMTALMAECLAARHGAVSARRCAAGLGETYLRLNRTGRKQFLEILATEFCVDQPRVRQLAKELEQCTDEELFQRQLERLRESLIPPRQQLLQQFNALPQGVKFLIDMRSELLEFATESPALKRLDYDLKQLLATWFDVGFLDVERISWKSSASLLEKLMSYEAVHAISSWSDLRHRLESDRHCYAFFHPVLPDEPLIFIEVALVKGLAGSVQDLLDEKAPEVDPNKADTAIFYSINNAQAGLKGISFGPFLVKEVVQALRHSLPNLKTFSTLSPIPGFRAWLEGQLAREKADENSGSFNEVIREAATLLGIEADFTLLMDDPHWPKNPDVCAVLKEPLLILCARYLHELRSKDGAPLDSVARFHLGNGARIEQLNWLGDTSGKGMRESCGLMVNYLYPLEEMEANIEAYAGHKQIAAAPRIHKLLAQESKQGLLSGLRRLLTPGRGEKSGY